MAAEIIKGPGRSNITYRDGADEVRIPVSPAAAKDGKAVFDVFLKDAKMGNGQPASLVLREKIRRTLKTINPLDGDLNVH